MMNYHAKYLGLGESYCYDTQTHRHTHIHTQATDCSTRSLSDRQWVQFSVGSVQMPNGDAESILQHRRCQLLNKLEKLSWIEHRGQTASVTVLPCSYI